MARPRGPIQHGTIYAYNHRKCRCEACKAANRAKHARSYMPHPRAAPPRRARGLDNSLIGEVTAPTKSFEAMLGAITPERLHCRIIMQNGVPYEHTANPR
jgi:hypothetical protein